MKKRSILFLGAIIIVVMTMVALFTANVSAYPLCGNARHDCDNPSVCLCADCRTDERVQTDMVVLRRRNELDDNRKSGLRQRVSAQLQSSDRGIVD